MAGIGALVHQWLWLLQLLRFGGAGFLAIHGAMMAAQRAIRGGGELITAGTANQHWRAVVPTSLAFTFLNPRIYLDTMLLLGSLSALFRPGPGVHLLRAR